MDHVTATAWFWTLFWLKAAPEPIHALRVPVAYCVDDQGYLAHLILEHHPRPVSDATKRPVLIEHPVNALDPCKRDLLDTIEQAFEWGFDSGGASGVVTWRLARDENHGDLVLGGDSLGGAAAATPQLTYDQLARRAWHPDWQPVVIMLAGMLDEPLPLLEALYAEKHRDLSHDRLALVIKCLVEVDEEKRTDTQSGLPKLATEFVGMALSLIRSGQAEITAVDTIWSALAVFEQVRDELISRLDDVDPSARRMAAEALANLEARLPPTE